MRARARVLTSVLPASPHLPPAWERVPPNEGDSADVGCRVRVGAEGPRERWEVARTPRGVRIEAKSSSVPRVFRSVSSSVSVSASGERAVRRRFASINGRMAIACQMNFLPLRSFWKSIG